MTRELSENFFLNLQKHKYVSLKTFYKSSEGVATPVWFIVLGNKLYVNTREDTYKMKRILSNENVQIAQCSIRGKENSRYFDAKAKILADSEDLSRIIKKFRQKYRFFRFVSYITYSSKKKGKKSLFIEIVLHPNIKSPIPTQDPQL